MKDEEKEPKEIKEEKEIKDKEKDPQPMPQVAPPDEDPGNEDPPD